MTLASMTGFARTTGDFDHGFWAWEAKSVNGRGLDVRTNLPSGLEQVESRIKKAAGALFSRGNLQISLRLEWRSVQTELTVNEVLLGKLSAAYEATAGHPPTGDALATLMTVKGVTEARTRSGSDLQMSDLTLRVLEAGGLDVRNGLQTSRSKEGAALATLLSGFLADMRVQVELAEGLAGQQADLISERYRDRLEQLDADKIVAEDRIAIEVAALSVKADISEEIDRLKAHLNQVETLINGPDPVGRSLGFICQELAREANTLCAKSASLELTQIGLSLKGLIDQFKEQVANVK